MRYNLKDCWHFALIMVMIAILTGLQVCATRVRAQEPVYLDDNPLGSFTIGNAAAWCEEKEYMPIIAAIDTTYGVLSIMAALNNKPALYLGEDMTTVDLADRFCALAQTAIVVDPTSRDLALAASIVAFFEQVSEEFE